MSSSYKAIMHVKLTLFVQFIAHYTMKQFNMFLVVSSEPAHQFSDKMYRLDVQNNLQIQFLNSLQQNGTDFWTKVSWFSYRILTKRRYL